METDVTLETADFQRDFTFTDAKLVTRTKDVVVVALSNAQGERLVVKLPKAVLAELGDWRDLFRG
jgi:hypothetical protein